MVNNTRRLGIILIGTLFIAAAGQNQLPREKATLLADNLISVHGHVKVPDGRGLAGVNLALVSTGGQATINMSATTSSAGFYSFGIQKSLAGKTVQLSASFPAAPGAPFNPNGRFFSLTENPGALDFIYQGPLPDLSCYQANIFFEPDAQGRHFYIYVKILNGINNGQGLSCGPSKARVTYEDRTVNPWKTKEIVFPVPALGMGLFHIEDHLSIGVYPSASYFKLLKVEVDIENVVFELNEGNNVKTFN